MKTKIAILVGTLANGFHIDQILEDVSKAEDAVIGHLANGKLAEAMEVKLPSSISQGETDYAEGTVYVVLGSGLAGGADLYGPFPADTEASKDFGEAFRGDDGEWELLVFESIQSKSERLSTTDNLA